MELVPENAGMKELQAFAARLSTRRRMKLIAALIAPELEALNEHGDDVEEACLETEIEELAGALRNHDLSSDSWEAFTHAIYQAI